MLGITVTSNFQVFFLETGDLRRTLVIIIEVTANCLSTAQCHLLSTLGLSMSLECQSMLSFTVSAVYLDCSAHLKDHYHGKVFFLFALNKRV